jgi:hypothetical protein
MFAAPAVVLVRLYVAVPVPGAVAVTLYEPAVLLAVNTAAVATPLALVVAVFTPPANTPLGPEPGAVNDTTTPPTGLPNASVTVASRFTGNAVLTVVLCGVPAVAAMLAAPPEVFVKLYVAVPVPGAVAVTLYEPAVLFAVNTAAVATPLVLVVAVLTPPANVPLAPDPGAVNVTTTPLTGFPKPSVTVA